MNGRLRVLAVVVMGGAAQAAPSPPPPEGFAGEQYIDGQGCVFTRADAGWTARLDGQGQALCGFPPSLAARRTDPDADRVLPLTESPPPDVETLLIEQLSRDLRPGEWTADPRPAETRAAPQPSRRTDPMQVAVQDALSVAPALRDASGLAGSPDLCARLGYRADPEGSQLGSTLGLCPGMRADPVAHTLTAGADAGKSAPALATPAAAAPSPAPKTAAAPAAAAPEPRRQAVRREATPAAVPAPSAAKPARRTPAEGPEMIPASARYVQIGAYADQDAAAALRSLAGRGYPVGQSRADGKGTPLRLIMAGPFADRRSLIAALNDLRRNGYPGAVAR